MVEAKGFETVARRIRDLDQKATGLAGRMKTLASTVGTKLVAALQKAGQWMWRMRYRIFALGSAAAYLVFKPFMELELMLKRVEVAAGATSDQMAQMSEMAKQLGRDTLYTASQAAEGMLYMSKAGFSAEETIGAIPAVLNAAIIEQMDLGTAAQLVTGMLYEFELGADSAGEAAALLARGSNLANTDMMEMGESLKYFGVTAHELGYSLSDSVTMMDLLAQKMIRGTMAGTGLSMGMMKFQQVMAMGFTDDQLEVFDKLGLNARKLDADVQNGTLDFLGFLKVMKQAGADAGYFGKIFEARAGRALNALAEGLGENWDLIQKTLAGSEEWMENSTDILEDSLWGQVQQIKSSVQTMTNAIAETFAGGLQDFLENTLRPWINRITKVWEEGGDTWQEKLGAVWGQVLLPTIERGMKALTEKIMEWIPTLAVAMGKLGVELIVAFAQGLVQGLYDSTVGTALDAVKRTFGVAISGGLPRQNYFGGAAAPSPYYQDLMNNLEQQNINELVSAAAGHGSLASYSEANPIYGSVVRSRLGLEGEPDLGGMPFADWLRGALEGAITALEQNTEATVSNTDGSGGVGDYSGGSGSGFLSKLFGAASPEEFFMKGAQQLGGTLWGYVTDPLQASMDRAMGPTMTRLERVGDGLFNLLNFQLTAVNAGLDIIAGLLGAGPENQMRGPSQGGQVQGVTIQQMNVNGYANGEDVGQAAVEEIRTAEAMANRSTVRSMQNGMVKREAMEY